jgi:ADP-ribose pyrophosphatase
MMRGMGQGVERETIYEGAIFDLERVRFATDDGAAHERDVVRHPGAVTIVAMTGEGEIALIRNTRAAVGRTLWECPAGKLESGEAPAACAARELEEETGWAPSGGADALVSLGEFYTTPGITDELMRVFFARGLERREQRLEAGERIEVEMVPAGRALEMVDSGEIIDGKTIVALLVAARRGLLDGGGGAGS